MKKKEYDVVVVGAGLVGLSFVNMLVTHLNINSNHDENFKIAILEKQPLKKHDSSNKFDSRVVALTESSRMLLENFGVWDNISNERVCPFERMEIWESDGTGHIEFDCNDIRQNSLGYIVENSLVIKCNLDKIKEFKNVELIYPATVTDLTRESQSNTSTITLGDGTTIVAKLLVAADGGDSKV